MEPFVKPFVGATVHFVIDKGMHALECRPGIVLRCRGDVVDLRIFTMGLDDGALYAAGHKLQKSVPYGNGAHIGQSWHWPHEGCQKRLDEVTRLE